MAEVPLVPDTKEDEIVQEPANIPEIPDGYSMLHQIDEEQTISDDEPGVEDCTESQRLLLERVKHFWHSGAFVKAIIVALLSHLIAPAPNANTYVVVKDLHSCYETFIDGVDVNMTELLGLEVRFDSFGKYYVHSVYFDDELKCRSYTEQDLFPRKRRTLPAKSTLLSPRKNSKNTSIIENVTVKRGLIPATLKVDPALQFVAAKLQIAQSGRKAYEAYTALLTKFDILQENQKVYVVAKRKKREDGRIKRRNKKRKSKQQNSAPSLRSDSQLSTTALMVKKGCELLKTAGEQQLLSPSQVSRLYAHLVKPESKEAMVGLIAAMSGDVRQFAVACKSAFLEE